MLTNWYCYDEHILNAELLRTALMLDYELQKCGGQFHVTFNGAAKSRYYRSKRFDSMRNNKSECEVLLKTEWMKQMTTLGMFMTRERGCNMADFAWHVSFKVTLLLLNLSYILTDRDSIGNSTCFKALLQWQQSNSQCGTREDSWTTSTVVFLATTWCPLHKLRRSFRTAVLMVLGSWRYNWGLK